MDAKILAQTKRLRLNEAVVVICHPKTSPTKSDFSINPVDTNRFYRSYGLETLFTDF